MSRLLLFVLFVITSPALAAPAPFAKPERRTDLDSVRGEWDVVSEELHVRLNMGRGTSSIRYSPKRDGHKAVITGHRLLWCAEGRVMSEEAIRLDKGQIDLTDAQSRVTRLGIYKVAGDVIVICTWSAGKADRPKSFEPDLQGQTAYVLRRKR
jgi:uncharacterized protein (TIGR03067 family)